MDYIKVSFRKPSWTVILEANRFENLFYFHWISLPSVPVKSVPCHWTLHLSRHPPRHRFVSRVLVFIVGPVFENHHAELSSGDAEMFFSLYQPHMSYQLNSHSRFPNSFFRFASKTLRRIEVIAHVWRKVTELFHKQQHTQRETREAEQNWRILQKTCSDI